MRTSTLQTSPEFSWVSSLYPVLLLHSVSFAALALMASMPAACFVFRAIFFLFLSECSLISSGTTKGHKAKSSPGENQVSPFALCLHWKLLQPHHSVLT